MFSPKKVRRPHSEIELEEIFLDKLVKKQEKETEIQERKLEVPLKKANFLILLLLGFFIIGVLLGTTFKLQAKEGEKFRALAAGNKFIISNFSAERGIIYDRNKTPLVLNEASFDLFLEKSKVPEENKEEIFKEVGSIIGGDIESLLKQSSEEEVLIKKGLGHRELVVLETKKDKLPGFEVRKRILRRYETEGALSHILGYLGKISSQDIKSQQDYEYRLNDYIGKEGLERVYEEVLRERKGKLQIERTAQGREVSRKIIEYPQSGDSLVLSLDFALQKKSKEVLARVIKEVGAEKGVVIALNPRNGEVLASVSLPSFNNNLFSRGITEEEFETLNEDASNPQLNRVIGGLYPTGSAIKPFIVIAALEEGIITESTTLYCPLSLCIPNTYNKDEATCFPDWQYHGWTDTKKAIAESVNPFFYMIGGGYTAPSRDSPFFDERLPRKFNGLGVERIAEYLRLFGFGKETAVDLPGELKGRVPTPAWKEDYFSTPQEQKWYLGDTYNLSIGQGYLLVTPLQLGVAFCAVANGGKLVKPKLAQRIVNPLTGEEREVPSQVIRQDFISQESLGILQEGMRQTVSSPVGSAYRLNDLPVKAAAKTGTAQIYPQKEIYHNWIAVFAPYESPEIVMVVLIESVEGLRIAAQATAKEILEWYFSRPVLAK